MLIYCLPKVLGLLHCIHVCLQKFSTAVHTEFKMCTFLYFQKQDKYSVNKLKALHARNEYLLNIEVANAAINKYFSDDVSDLMDVSFFFQVVPSYNRWLCLQVEHKNTNNISVKDDVWKHFSELYL